MDCRGYCSLHSRNQKIAKRLKQEQKKKISFEVETYCENDVELESVELGELTPRAPWMSIESAVP